MFAKSAILAVLAVVINAGTKTCAPGKELVYYDENDQRCELDCPDGQKRDPVDKLCMRKIPDRPRPPQQPTEPVGPKDVDPSEPQTTNKDPFYVAIQSPDNWKKYAGLNLTHKNGRDDLRAARTKAAQAYLAAKVAQGGAASALAAAKATMDAATKNAQTAQVRYQSAVKGNSEAINAKSSADKNSENAIEQQKKVAGEVTAANKDAKHSGAVKNAAQDALVSAATGIQTAKKTAYADAKANLAVKKEAADEAAATLKSAEKLYKHAKQVSDASDAAKQASLHAAWKTHHDYVKHIDSYGKTGF